MTLHYICADDSPVCCLGIEQILREAGYQLSACVSRFNDLQAHLEKQHCDVIVSEMRLDDVDVLDWFGPLLKNYPHTKLVIYTFNDNATYPARASAAGAFDFVLKRQPLGRLVQSFRAVELNTAPDGSMLKSAKEFMKKTTRPNSSAFSQLTKREVQIITHLSLGLSNREIGQSLGISLETVKEHVQNVLRKLNVTDRTAAAVWALRNGLPMLEVSNDGLISIPPTSGHTHTIHSQAGHVHATHLHPVHADEIESNESLEQR